MVPRPRIDPAQRRARLLRRHRLAVGRRTDDVVAIADDLVALHSTDPVTVYLSAAARMRRPALAAVDAALYGERTLLRHHAMRRTLWVLGHEAARLAHYAATLDLLVVQRRTLLAALAGGGIDAPEAWLADARTAVLATLTEAGPLSARELGRRLPRLSLPVPIGSGRSATTQSALSRVLLVLGFEGSVLRARPTGTWINGQYRWAAAGSWVPGGLGEPLDPRAAAAGLARRCLRAFGPLTRTDLKWWTGWTVATTGRALADVGAVEVDLDGGPGHLLPDDLEPVPAEEPAVALLPGLDPSTMGWKERDWYLDPALAPALFDRNGNAGPTVWADGRIVGGWVQRRDGPLAVRLLADVGAEHRAAVDAAAHDLEVLLGHVRFAVRFPAPLQAELLA
ncbi:MAG TPA: winged helix DNA-binding domain-containing protein [Pseudonocardia sp.]|nr:winged helix DNA-binding domain-containing protein [Pseudonocardia sp.]